MEKFSVKQLAELAGISVRTLHHYDEIGLLKPTIRTEAKYRYYSKEDLLRLQQIMFYRELDIPLAQIGEILDDENFNVHDALVQHKKELQKRKKRMGELIATIDNTIKQLKNTTMNYNEMYKGFTTEQAEAYEKEAKERWGHERVEESKARASKLSPEQMDKLRREPDEINVEMAKLMHLPVSDEKVQQLIKWHFAWVGNFYEVSPEIYKCLGEMYVSDERFKANYEKHKEGLAEYFREAMLYFLSLNPSPEREGL